MPKRVAYSGSFSSTDASGLSEAASRITLYKAGTTTEITLASGDTVYITDVIITVGGTLRIQLYDGADNSVGAGEEILETVLGANTTGPAHSFLTPHQCQVGTYPKVKANSSGDVQVTIKGFVEVAAA